MPSRARRATSADATTVSTMASGTAPMAARSLTLASTAATPAPYGSWATNAGGDGLAAHHQVAADEGPVVARPGQPVRGPEDLCHHGDGRLVAQPGIGPDRRRQRLDILH